MTHNFLAYGGKIIAQVIGEILYFPFWWYSVGFGRLLKKVYNSWRDQEKSLGLSVWAKNIFVPMYGQYDIAGRLISFFVRSAQVIGRGLMMAVWSVLLLVFIVFWLALPFLIVMATTFQFLS